MDREGIESAFERVFDQPLLFHGFTAYIRDYEMLFDIVDTPEAQREYLRYRFRYCALAEAGTSLSYDVWTQSLDDSLVTFDEQTEATGYVWGVMSQEMYPGAALLKESERANSWSTNLGIPFYEAEIETNVQKITLVFSDLEVSEVAVGYVPFTLRDG